MGSLTHRQFAIEIAGRAEGEGAARRWPVVVSTENPVRRRDIYGEEYDEVLSHAPGAVDLSRAPLPVLEGHDSSRVNIGIIDGLRLEGGKLRGEMVLGSSARARELADDIDAGIVRGTSVGYEILEQERSDVDGRQRLTATLWRPYEGSIVSIPADIDAGINRSADMADATDQDIRQTEADAARADDEADEEQRAEGDCECAGEPDCECEEREAEAASGGDQAEAPAADARSTATAGKRTKRSKPAPRLSPADLERARAEGEKQERDRIAGIHRAVRAAKLPDDFAEKLVNDKVSLAAARKLVLERLEERDMEIGAGRTPTGHVTAGEDNRDKWLRSAASWLIFRAGLEPQMRQAAQKAGEKFEAGNHSDHRGMSMADMARDALERAGVKTRGLDRHALIGKALTYRAGGVSQTTSDFATLLENVMHKVLLGSYAITPDTWSRFCAVGSVTDFRPHPRYRLGVLRSLDEVNEHGEFKNQKISDAEKESITASTKGNIISITRQSLMNDDMSAFSRLAVAFGRASRLSIEKAVYDLLALNSGLGPAMSDGDTLFHANHNNISGGNALSVAALDEDAVLMALQAQGEEILDIKPEILLVPRALYGQAVSIVGAEFDTDNVGSVQNKFMMPNRVRNFVRDIVGTGRLSGTRRYLFADPNIVPTIEVAFLDGQQAPYLESQEGWRVDGVEWKCRLDFGVGAVDYRGAVTDAGA